MAMAVAGLEYIIKLNDMMTSPLKGVMKQIDDLGNRGKDAMMKVGIGAAGLVAAGMAVANALGPAVEIQRALGEVKSLGVAEDALQKLQATALDFTSAYGGAAADFVRSSYDIQSAIAGLNGNELSTFTEASNLLAKGTKASAGTITNYMGTMYGIFADEAQAMGNADWVNKIAGQTALAVKQFKTSGDGMSSAFTALGAAAKASGIDVAEQFAVLGNLQATMSGSEAGTKYKAFLRGVQGAQKELGLTFTDSQNRMLDMPTILNKITGKFGDVLDESEAAQLKKAFGSDEAVALIKLLLPKVGELKNNVTDLANVTGTAEIEQMALAMVDPWQKLSSTLDNIKIAIGTEVLNAISPIADKIATLGKEFVTWLSTYKNIARWIGYITGALIGFGSVTATLTLLSGVIAAVGIAFAAITGPIGLVVGAIVGLGVMIYNLRDQFTAFISGFIDGFQSAGFSLDPVITAFGNIWQSVQLIWGSVVKVWSAIFGGTDSMSAFTSVGEAFGFVVGTAFSLVADAISLVATLIGGIAQIFADVADNIIEMWHGVVEGWQNSDPTQIFGALATGVGNIFSSIFNGIKNMFIDALNWIITQANKLSGVIGIEIPMIPVAGADELKNALPESESILAANDVPLALPQPVTAGEATGGLLNSTAQLATAAPLPDAVKPQLTQMKGSSVSNKIANTHNVNNSFTINGGVSVNANNAEEFEKTMRDKQALAS